MYHIEALLGYICIYHMKPLEVNKILRLTLGFLFFFLFSQSNCKSERNKNNIYTLYFQPSIRILE